MIVFVGKPHGLQSIGTPPYFHWKRFFSSGGIRNQMDDKKAIIISLHDDNCELKNLAESLDYKVEEIFVQHRDKPGGPLYIGKGKIDEIKEFSEKNDIECAIVNGTITPSQWYNMEKILGIKVYDRIHLILEIFADRAKRKEARLQVKLAYLRYEKPYIRELIHRTKMGEHPGFMAGGEYQVADYYEMIKKQIKKVKGELEKLEQGRESLNQYRRKKGFYLVTIAGYTNAGKSNLLNRLTEEHVKVEERLFSTLSTTTRIIKKKGKTPVLVTDTVGFIKDLPHWLIDSFHSTLKEIELADVVVLLVDGSEDIDTIIEKMRLSIKEITNINAHQKIVVGLNKSDLMDKNEINEKIERICREIGEIPCTSLSAKTGHNIEHLVKMIYDCIPDNTIIEASFPHSIDRQEISSLLADSDARLLNFDFNRKIRIICNDKVKEKIIGRFVKKGADVKII